MVAQTYTLAEVEELSGAERFDIQQWAREGLLQPLLETQGAGRGVPRRFNLVEVELAALMGRLSAYCSLKALRVFAKKYRSRAADKKFDGTEKRELIAAARDGDPTVYLSFILNGRDDGSIAIFRWDETSPRPPKRLSLATEGIVVNLAHAWSRIEKGNSVE